jgi:trehalose synthase-fused probable maltokinase
VKPRDHASLAAEIAEARWYGGKGEAIAEVREEDALDLEDGCGLRILRVGTISGAADLYLYLEGEERLGGPLLRALVEGRRSPGRQQEFVFEPGAALAGLMPSSFEQRPMGLDQSNTSLVVADRLVVKLYRRLEPGDHPEVELGRFLTDTAHIAFMPAYVGSVRWGDHAVAMVQAYISKARDGWSWATDCVVSGETAPFALLGKQTSALHGALAEVAARPATRVELRGWRQAAERQLDRALRLVEGETGAELARMSPAVRREFEAFERLSQIPMLTRVHGDYHIGQIVRFHDGLRVVDFEGEPTKPLAERTALGTPLRDVAAMLRSFDHLARYVDRDVMPGNPGKIERWLLEVRAAFLGGYGEHDPQLLRALEVEKETYEFIYAATFLPEWMYVAIGGMRWLMRGRQA